MIRVGINGYGTIGKRVAEAIALQDDMRLVGVVKTRPNYEALSALKKGFDIYIPREKEKEFIDKGIEFKGFIEDLLEKIDIVIDATPGGVGAKYKSIYEKYGLKMIFQGGEKAGIADLSFNSFVNYEKALGARSVRVVSCNTTGLVRVLWVLSRVNEIESVRAVIIRRGADPKEIDRGPINSLVLDPPSIPSHHALDVKTVLGDIDIETVAIASPTTLMHMHILNVRMRNNVSKEEVIEAFSKTPRIILIDSSRTGIKSSSEVIELARDLGRKRYDVYENVIFKDTIYVKGREIIFVQAIHQEAIVIPENIDAIRALSLIEKDPWKSIEKTDRSLGILSGEIR
ncbi:MAG: type II glyceraldehyde-3-phosphate dehydrogenase [Sulfolobales archaeon]